MDPDTWVLCPESGMPGATLCSSPHTWVSMSPGCSCRGGDEMSCMQRAVGVEHLGPASSPVMCPVGQLVGLSVVQRLEVSQAWVQLIPWSLGSGSECTQMHSDTAQVHLASRSRNKAGWL